MWVVGFFVVVLLIIVFGGSVLSRIIDAEISADQER